MLRLTSSLWGVLRSFVLYLSAVVLDILLALFELLTVIFLLLLLLWFLQYQSLSLARNDLAFKVRQAKLLLNAEQCQMLMLMQEGKDVPDSLQTTAVSSGQTSAPDAAAASTSEKREHNVASKPVDKVIVIDDDLMIIEKVHPAESLCPSIEVSPTASAPSKSHPREQCKVFTFRFVTCFQSQFCTWSVWHHAAMKQFVSISMRTSLLCPQVSNDFAYRPKTTWGYIQGLEVCCFSSVFVFIHPFVCAHSGMEVLMQHTWFSWISFLSCLRILFVGCRKMQSTSLGPMSNNATHCAFCECYACGKPAAQVRLAQCERLWNLSGGEHHKFLLSCCIFLCINAWWLGSEWVSKALQSVYPSYCVAELFLCWKELPSVFSWRKGQRSSKLHHWVLPMYAFLKFFQHLTSQKGTYQCCLEQTSTKQLQARPGSDWGFGIVLAFHFVMLKWLWLHAWTAVENADGKPIITGFTCRVNRRDCI